MCEVYAVLQVLTAKDYIAAAIHKFALCMDKCYGPKVVSYEHNMICNWVRFVHLKVAKKTCMTKKGVTGVTGQYLSMHVCLHIVDSLFT